jgi:hypothetical protein
VVKFDDVVIGESVVLDGMIVVSWNDDVVVLRLQVDTVNDAVVLWLQVDVGRNVDENTEGSDILVNEWASVDICKRLDCDLVVTGIDVEINGPNQNTAPTSIRIDYTIAKQMTMYQRL